LYYTYQTSAESCGRGGVGFSKIEEAKKEEKGPSSRFRKSAQRVILQEKESSNSRGHSSYDRGEGDRKKISKKRGKRRMLVGSLQQKGRKGVRTKVKEGKGRQYTLKNAWENTWVHLSTRQWEKIGGGLLEGGHNPLPLTRGKGGGEGAK